MYSRILTTNHSFREKIKRLIAYFRKRRGAKIAWQKRHAKVYTENREYHASCGKDVERIHTDLWSKFNTHIDTGTLRISANISGKADPRIVPEEIFMADIEPSLITDPDLGFLSNKSFYNQLFPAGKFPQDLLHRFDGQWYDRDFGRLDTKKFQQRISSFEYPVVVKPSSNSNGGQGVIFAGSKDQLIDHSSGIIHCVVQEKVRQHPFFASFHPQSINTIRVYLYRSVSDHRLHILSLDLTMGRSGASVNNEKCGGIYSGIQEDGTMVGYAVDKFGNTYKKHPDTGELFDQRIPDIDGLKQFAMRLGKQMLPAALVGLDLFCDEKGEWRAMEINTRSHSIRSAQYFGQPFFGGFTEEVIEYCSTHHWTIR